MIHYCSLPVFMLLIAIFSENIGELIEKVLHDRCESNILMRKTFKNTCATRNKVAKNEMEMAGSQA